MRYFIVIFIIVNLGLSFKLYYSNSNRSNKQQDFGNNSDIFKLIEEKDVKGNEIIPDAKLISTTSDTVSLEHITKKVPKIIFYFLDKNCWTCVERILIQCERYFEYEIIKDNIIIVAGYNNYKTFKSTFDVYNFSFDTFMHKGDFTNLYADTINKPLMMVVDSDYTAKMVYILTDENEVLLYNYFNNVYKKFYKNITKS